MRRLVIIILAGLALAACGGATNSPGGSGGSTKSSGSGY
jgi:ABC-type glycerol-3-phosphate transport system substrate-binding protein